MAQLNLPFGVYRSTRGDLDLRFRVEDDAAMNELIDPKDLVDVGHIIYHVTDGKHYKLKTYPTFGDLTGVEWEEFSSKSDVDAIDTSEWATYSGTRDGGDLIVSIGEYGGNGDRTKIVLNDGDASIKFSMESDNVYEFRVYEFKTPTVSIYNSNRFNGILRTDNITGDRTLDLPDADGTIALTNIDNEWSNEQTFNNHVNIGGALTVQGDIYSLGNTIQIDSQIVTADSVIVMNDGELGNGVTSGFSGFEIDRGSEDNFWFGFDEVRDRFTIGKITSLNGTQIATTQVVATRGDSIVNNNIVKWDNTLQQFVDSDKSITTLDDVAYTNADNNFSVDQTFQGKLTAPNLEIADIVNDHDLTTKEYVESLQGEFELKTDSTTSITLTPADKGKVISADSSSAITFTINTTSLTDIGDIAYVDQMGSGEVTFVASGVTLQYNASRLLKTDGQFSRVAIHKTGATTYRVFGELAQDFS